VSQQSSKKGTVVNFTDELGAALATSAPPAVTDIARLRNAFDRLEEAGFVVLDGGCCQGCNWGHIEKHHAEAVDIIHTNDQLLDHAFGEVEPSIEWRAYLDDAVDEAEAEQRFEVWMDNWYHLDFSGLNPYVAQRPGMLKNSLWLQHDGNTQRAIAVLREEGLDARWGGDRKHGIEILPKQSAKKEATVVQP
jgi:Domain of unknown function (DUF6891)